MKRIKEIIESNRTSKSLYWKILIYLKDSTWGFLDKIKKNNSIISFPIVIYYYFSIFFKNNNKREKKKEKVVAIVLSWKRTKNLPLVIAGLKKQSFIDDIYIYHNYPSKLWVPRCKNIFNKSNFGSIVRHQIATNMKNYDYFVFSDDDLMLKEDFSKEILEAIRKYGEKSVFGFFGHELNLKNKSKPYTSGKYKVNYKNIVPVDIVKGRFHIISKKGIEEMKKSRLDTPVLRSEDDIRANIALQKKFNKPSYLIPIKHKIIELHDNNALEHRSFHKNYRDKAIYDGLKKGWNTGLNRLHLIHIGKCAGSTIHEELIEAGINVRYSHLSKIKYHENNQYVIVIRNPISRFISAFNFGYYQVCIDKSRENQFKGEKELLNKYKTANNLAEDLYDCEGKLKIDLSKKEYYIHHIAEDINFYIGEFLKECNPDNIKAVIATETLKNDMKKHFNISVRRHIYNNNNNNTSLSKKAYNNLKKYLKKDYECIEKLNELGLFTKKKYKILSK